MINKTDKKNILAPFRENFFRLDINVGMIKKEKKPDAMQVTDKKTEKTASQIKSVKLSFVPN